MVLGLGLDIPVQGAWISGQVLLHLRALGCWFMCVCPFSAPKPCLWVIAPEGDLPHATSDVCLKITSVWSPDSCWMYDTLQFEPCLWRLLLVFTRGHVRNIMRWLRLAILVMIICSGQHGKQLLHLLSFFCTLCDPSQCGRTMLRCCQWCYNVGHLKYVMILKFCYPYIYIFFHNVLLILYNDTFIMHILMILAVQCGVMEY